MSISCDRGEPVEGDMFVQISLGEFDVNERGYSALPSPSTTTQRMPPVLVAVSWRAGLLWVSGRTGACNESVLRSSSVIPAPAEGEGWGICTSNPSSSSQEPQLELI